MRSGSILLTMLLAVFAAAANAQQPGSRADAQEGRRLALGKCDACHVVASDQPYPPLLSHYAPSFYDVANKPDINAKALEAFLAHPHWHEIMPPADLTSAQVSALTANILSLRGRH
jgi:mono/diheme cytochrome c family protein